MKKMGTYDSSVTAFNMWKDNMKTGFWESLYLEFEMLRPLNCAKGS